MTADHDATNPFHRYALDPREGPAGITARLRELAEDAEFSGDATRAAGIRDAWEALTRHPARASALSASSSGTAEPQRSAAERDRTPNSLGLRLARLRGTRVPPRPARDRARCPPPRRGRARAPAVGG